jgi:hypothetical protein
MDLASKPVEDDDRDPYTGTPLGVEAAWCPNGLPLPPTELPC